MRELALFAGAGGGILAGQLLGWRTVCAVEIDPYAASVLAARQADGTLDAFPIWDDVRTFDPDPWRGLVDVLTGGFPCQDISSNGNGARRHAAGIDGPRSSLWVEMARVVRVVRPRFVYVENAPELAVRGLDRVLGDLAALGYDAEWTVLGADDLGAPHQRKRLWLLAHTDRWSDPPRGDGQGDPAARTCPVSGCGWGSIFADGGRGRQLGLVWPVEPQLGRVADGVPHRLDRLRTLGNAQVPRVAAAAFSLLRARGGWSMTP
jgi:DNA (cytosine-5)-methyltransferase 1